MNDFQLAEVFPPGEFLKDELEERGWSQTDLAEIMGRHVSVINELITAKRGLTPETAQALADALGGSAQFWLNLESMYRLSLLPKSDVVTRRARLYSRAPIRELIRRHWIEDSQSIEVLEKQVLDFLDAPDFSSDSPFAHAARKSTSYNEPPSVSQKAWLCRARQLASAVPVETFNKNRLPELVDALRSLAEAPENIAAVPKLLASYGIRFLVIEPLSGTKLDGASFWLGQTPVLVLSLRYDRIDHFWFTLMHEIAHIFHGDGTILDLDIAGDRPALLGEPEAVETRADAFASDALIPSAVMRDFINRVRPMFSALRIQAFARTLGVHAGIVVGQLQHLHEIKYANLRDMLVPVRGIITRTALTDGWGTQLPTGL